MCGIYLTYFPLIQFVQSFSNALIDFMLNGTAVKEALNHGKNLDAEPCEKIYSSCPLDREQTMQILAKLLPGVNTAAN